MQEQARALYEHSWANDAYCTSSTREAHFGGHQPGAIVVRPHHLAFIPTGGERGLTRVAGRVALGLAGVQLLRLPGGVSPEQAGVEVARQLACWPAAQIDAHAAAMAREADGVVWTPAEAVLVEEKLLLGVRLYFAAGRDRVHVGFAKQAIAHPAFARMRSFFWRAGHS